MEKAKVLLIYTGGTIGMIEDPETGALKAFDFNELESHLPELARIDVDLTSVTMAPPIDSSDMNPTVWKELATMIYNQYEAYDGFVVLHGSDTMAYTASALSFMLQGIQKPLILTGSQLPIGKIRTDGKENLITAIEIAATRDKDNRAIIQEVAIYFEYRLYRGNRTTKVSAHAFEAFQSPNYPKLAKAGVSITYDYLALFRPQTKNVRLYTEMEERIALIKIFPGFSPAVYKDVFDVNTVKGIVLETFGAGNAPNNPAFHSLLRDYIASGGVVVNITQCFSGAVDQGKYANSTMFNEIGVVSGKSMTTEAAITKTMHLLGIGTDSLSFQEALHADYAGEMDGDLY